MKIELVQIPQPSDEINPLNQELVAAFSGLSRKWPPSLDHKNSDSLTMSKIFAGETGKSPFPHARKSLKCDTEISTSRPKIIRGIRLPGG